MQVYRKFLAFAVVLSASGAAYAQSDGEGAAAPRNSSSSGSSWQSYTNERHLLGRLEFGAAWRLSDPWGAGYLAPPYALAQASYLFVNVGSFHMGPSLGLQLGVDFGHGPAQFAVQPGWMALTRFSPQFGLSLRADIPFMVTRSRCMPQDVAAPTGSPVQAPISGCLGLGIGVELGGAFLWYLTSGIALTAEVNASLYVGDSGFTYPLLGVGIGAVIDYEILP